MGLSVEPPPPPTLTRYDDLVEDETAESYRIEELEAHLEDGAWEAAFERWSRETDLDEEDFDIACDMELFAEFEFFWDDFAQRVGYNAPGIPDDWQDRSYHEDLATWKTVSGINAAMTELGQIVCDILKDDYIDWAEETFEADPELPDYDS